MVQAITLYDTTLRDGAQTEGISLSVNDKLLITEKLVELAVPYVEGGWPGASPKEMEFFRKVKRLKLKGTQVVAFGSTRRANRPVGKDAQLQGLLSAQTRGITIFGKSWDLHVRDALRVTLEENLKMIGDSISYLRRRGKIVMYDAEHFFDGYRENPDYAMKTLQVAQDHGAHVVILCDTNGGTLPDEIRQVVAHVRQHLSVKLGIHCHNDADVAVANSIAAVCAGVTHVQGTVNGYGERCGNMDLIPLIATLQLKLGHRLLDPEQLLSLTDVSNFIAAVANLNPDVHAPYVGRSAFAHKGGIHVSGVARYPDSYQHIDPAQVGNRMRVVVSELSGRGNVRMRARALGLPLNDNEATLVQQIKERESQGFQFEAAEGSFEMLVRRAAPGYRPPFTLLDFTVWVEKRGESAVMSQATVKLQVGEETMHTAGEGVGPVFALDQAIRKALVPHYPELAETHLVDYKVRIVDADRGTAARPRVVIETACGGERWSTVGCSENIMEASWLALWDSLELPLLRKRGAQPAPAVAGTVTG